MTARLCSLAAFAAILCLPTAALSASAPPDYQEQQSNVIYKRVDEMAVSPLAAGGVRVVYRRGSVLVWCDINALGKCSPVQKIALPDGVTAVEQPIASATLADGRMVVAFAGHRRFKPRHDLFLAVVDGGPVTARAVTRHGQEHEAIRPSRFSPTGPLRSPGNRHATAPAPGWPGASFRQAAIRSARRSASPTSAVRPTRPSSPTVTGSACSTASAGASRPSATTPLGGAPKIAASSTWRARAFAKTPWR